MLRVKSCIEYRKQEELVEMFKVVCTLLVLGLSLTSAASRSKRQAARGPLYDYVHHDDGMFSWSEYSMVEQDGLTTYFINMTSQQWYDETLSDRYIWWHFVTIHVPDNLRFTDSSFLFIGKGRNTDSPPSVTSGQILEMGQIAVSTGMITGHVKTIPNQPIIMENDGRERTEDTFIAWTWKRFYNETVDGIDNPEILARMPMCKGSVRAMDTIQEFVKERFDLDIENFMIAGQSKRGWTTWLTAAVDDRVIAMAPVVLTCLNMVENFHHYYQSFGGWPFAMLDYWAQGIMGLLDTPETKAMTDIIDPMSYKEYLDMPKLIVSGASDEFFLVDDYAYFFHDLPGEKKIWMIENSGHEVQDSELGEVAYWEMLGTFYLGVLQGFQAPSMDWTIQHTDTSGSIILLSPSQPRNISVWSSPSIAPDRRDWRNYYLEGVVPVESGVVWTMSEPESLGNGYYRAEFDIPEEGYLAFFIKVVYEGPEGRDYYSTTEVAIIPNNFPHEDCYGSDCFGRLV